MFSLCSSLGVLWCGHWAKGKLPGVWSKVGLRKHDYNKASGGDGIAAEILKILKDDAVKVL